MLFKIVVIYHFVFYKKQIETRVPLATCVHMNWFSHPEKQKTTPKPDSASKDVDTVMN